jgi:hypothetical protein
MESLLSLPWVLYPRCHRTYCTITLEGTLLEDSSLSQDIALCVYSTVIFENYKGEKRKNWSWFKLIYRMNYPVHFEFITLLCIQGTTFNKHGYTIDD